MKNSRIYFYIILTVIVLLSVFALFEHQKQIAKSNQAGEATAPTENNSNLATNQISKQPQTQIFPGKIISDTTTSSNRIVVAEKDGVRKTAHIPLSLAGALTDEQILQTLFSNQANAPTHKGNGQPLNKHLTFYGLTVDDQTNIVSGAMVVGNVMVWDEQNPSRQVPVETTSDGDGRFQFDVDNGQLIMISVSKGTNYISPAPQWFQYGPVGDRPIYYPDPNNPTIFVLTKKKLEPLVETERGFTAPNTGEPVRIDLTTGEVVTTGGDLIVSITCPEPFKAGVHIPWKLVLQTTGGGFISVGLQRMEYMLEAPESGYSDMVIIDHPADDPNWDSQYDDTFYIKSRNGQIYGKMIFDMNTRWDERGVPFRFHSFVNKSGSRNLQNASQ
jgi:hypothetical protein